MGKIQYCKKIQKAIKDEEKDAIKYINLQVESTDKTAIAVFGHISNDEGRHNAQLNHLYARIC